MEAMHPRLQYALRELLTYPEEKQEEYAELILEQLEEDTIAFE
jgi:hypothetical protein